MTTTRNGGFSRIDLIATLACSCIALMMVTMVLGEPADTEAPKFNRTLKDAGQLRQIFMGMVIFANENNGAFPSPGMINRLPFNGVEVPGRGNQDVSKNTTASLFSAMIMRNLFSADLAVSPVERNPRVKVHANYDYETFDPSRDLYWDGSFTADLTKESNTSYAHAPLHGSASKEWRNTADSRQIVLGNRGPKDGATDPDSITCGPHGHWDGNVMHCDGHVHFHRDPRAVLKEGEAEDNLFARDRNGEPDAFLSFTLKVENGLPVFQHD